MIGTGVALACAIAFAVLVAAVGCVIDAHLCRKHEYQMERLKQDHEIVSKGD